MTRYSSDYFSILIPVEPKQFKYRPADQGKPPKDYIDRNFPHSSLIG